MTRRRLMWVGVVACVVLTLAAAGWRAVRPHPVNRANSERIREGMTCAEVEAILRGPPGDYTTSDCVPFPRFFDVQKVNVWISNEGRVWVRFDKDGRVAWSNFRPAEVEPTPLQRLSARLGW